MAWVVSSHYGKVTFHTSMNLPLYWWATVIKQVRFVEKCKIVWILVQIPGRTKIPDSIRDNSRDLNSHLVMRIKILIFRKYHDHAIREGFQFFQMEPSGLCCSNSLKILMGVCRILQSSAVLEDPTPVRQHFRRIRATYRALFSPKGTSQWRLGTIIQERERKASMPLHRTTHKHIIIISQN